MSKTKTYTDKELLYAATARCQCGAGLAYPLNHDEAWEIKAWVCSVVLKDATSDASQHQSFPWAFYKIREESSINNKDGTTRPAGTICRTVGKATCGSCGHKWESEPYDARGVSHHWFPMACPKCGNDCGATGTWSSNDKRPRVETRYHDVVMDETP